MKILIDAMGGDHAPQEIVKGALQAHEAYGAEIVLIGQREAVEPCLTGAYRPEIIDAREVVTMEDDPSTATRRKKAARSPAPRTRLCAL